MSTQHYVEQPHLEIQRALAQARREGATNATITLDRSSKTATLEDNRNSQELHSRTFNINTHPATASFSQLASDIREHPTPEGMETTLVSKYTQGQEYSETLHPIDHLLLARGITPDGRYRISVTGRRRNFPALVGADGASSTLNFYFILHAIKETESREPGSPVTNTGLGTVIETLHPAGSHHLDTDDLPVVSKTIAKLTADCIHDKEASSNGCVWPNRALREYISQHDPLQRTMPQAPSVSDYHTLDEKGVRRTTTCLTPTNAVFCDYDSVQTSMLTYAVREHAPRDVIPVNTSDPNVPTIRLLNADVENLDGTTTEYPVHLWHMEGRSGRQDNHAAPTGERLPHSRIERVKKVSLTMEIRQHQTQETDVFTFDTDVYADQDRTHHLLLVTKNATVSQSTLQDIAYLHSPRYDDTDMPERLREAMDQPPDEWYNDWLLDTLYHGPRAAAQRLMKKIADFTEALDLTNPQTGASELLSVTSPNRKVQITLNPRSRTKLQMAASFFRFDPAKLDIAQTITVPTEESPGAIFIGHVLRYSRGKLETFQPEDTDVFKMVHPLTVRPDESEALEVIRSQPDTRWAVVGRGNKILMLTPMPETSTE